MASFGDTERHIKDLFIKESKFSYGGHDYVVLECGKPAPSKGECKTDVYVLAQDENGDKREFKISVKKSNADFLENKISLERAEQILGGKAQEIIKNGLKKIKQFFEDDYLICFESYRNTKAGSIKLGWKFEFTNKQGGKKCGQIPLAYEQKIDIYAGTTLEEDKKNCEVNGKVIKDSGVANYIIVVDKISRSLDFYIHSMQPIKDFVKGKEISFVCKALNYRISDDKWDGDRPLAVYVDWVVKDHKLYGKLVYNNPLAVKGNEIGLNIRNILASLGIDKKNFTDLKKILDKSVKKFG